MNEPIQPLGPNKLPTVANWAAEYLTQKKPGWAHNTWMAAEIELRRFAVFVGARELTPKILADYQANQQARKCKPTSLFKSIEWPQRLLEWLEDMDMVERRRFTKILKKPAKPYEKIKAFTHAQYEALKEVAKGTMWYYAVIMAYRIGTRYSDTALMKWECVDMEKLCIDYVPYKSRKTGRPALCPFEAGGDLHRVLLDLSGSRHQHPMWGEYVCPEMAMTYPRTTGFAPSSYRSKFRNLCVKIGAAKGLSFHSLRHSFISRLVQGGASYPVGSQITGLSSPMIFARYAKPDLPTLRNAIGNMSKNDEPPDEAGGTIIKLPAA